MNRKIILLVSFLPFAFGCIGQKKNYFEGKVFYSFEITSNKPTLDPSMLRTIFGNSTTLSFKEGNYYHEYDGGLMEYDMYDQKENKFYFKKRGNDSIYWYNCGLPGEKINKFDYTAGKEIILGINCDELIMHYNDKIVSHYYNSDSLSLDPGWFEHYISDDEYLIDKKERAIYLKSIADYSNFIVVETATKFTRQKINSAIFRLDPKTILVEQK